MTRFQKWRAIATGRLLLANAIALASFPFIVMGHLGVALTMIVAASVLGAL